MFGKIYILILTSLLFGGCLSFDTRPAITEKNKVTMPKWAMKESFFVEKEPQGSLLLVAIAEGAPTLDAGADEAFEKANVVFNKYLTETYFGKNMSSEEVVKLKTHAAQILNDKKASNDYKICDIYYEKREVLSVKNNELVSKYDTFLCLRIKAPQELVIEIKKSINGKNIEPIKDLEDTKIAH
jgi:hypothetical protein